MRYLLTLFVTIFVPILTAGAAAAPQPNVLFIAVDDLRPQILSFGREKMVTPNIDRLAERGVHFRRAYCMVPTCGASRASLMTGLRPARNRFVNYQTYAEKDAPGIKTLNTHFKENGYYTVSLGKIFHHTIDNGQGWSELPWRPNGPTYKLRESLQKLRDNPRRRGRGPAFESADVPDNFYRDGQLADKAIEDLSRLAKQEQPFFLAVGFFKPHLPFVAPTRYWENYPLADVHLPDNYFVPKGAPPMAIHSSGELRAYADVPGQGPVEDEFARRLIHGYYACVSYTDAHIGRLLDQLDKLGVADNTIIVLWGDHGWNLGEHTLWCKHCCFETSMNAPLIVSAPMLEGMKTGAATTALTEFIDIYPSLCDLAGLPLPEHLQGESFVPVLNDPDASVKQAAIGRYGAGDTIRTAQYRFTLFEDRQGQPVGRMLYDHQEDPGENMNVAERPENAELVRQLTERLKAGMGKPSPAKRE